MASKTVKFTFNPFELAGVEKPEKITRSQMKRVMNLTSRAVLESVTTDMDRARSSVDGSKFDKLDPKYAQKKRSAGLSPTPNLEFSGKLKDSIRVERDGDTLTLTTLQSQQGKADGHCNHTGKSKLPERRFIPDADQTFRDGIKSQLVALIESALEEPDDE